MEAISLLSGWLAQCIHYAILTAWRQRELAEPCARGPSGCRSSLIEAVYPTYRNRQEWPVFFEWCYGCLIEFGIENFGPECDDSSRVGQVWIRSAQERNRPVVDDIRRRLVQGMACFCRLSAVTICHLRFVI